MQFVVKFKNSFKNNTQFADNVYFTSDDSCHNANISDNYHQGFFTINEITTT